MEICVLGPVEVHVRDRVIPAGPPQQSTVLASLAVDAGRSAPVEVLVDRVWGESPPDRARRTLHTHITRIRRLLEHAGADSAAILRHAGGYQLRIDPDQVDLHRFRRLCESTRDPEYSGQRRVLREALALWRGEPLAGLPGQWAAGLREAWRQEHLDTVVAWAQAELDAGHPTAVTGPLASLLHEYPLVEPLTATLMRALSAAGRSAQALTWYAATRRRLVDELGVEPGPELQELHKAILRGDLPRSTADLTRARPRRPVPQLLPMDASAFVGRVGEVARLDALLAAADRPATTTPVAVVSGTPGVGKTALAVHWAHRVAGRFPDGHLYVNLRGYDTQRPTPPSDALAHFLSALEVPGAEMPVGLDERAARYRSELAGRRMLILLDNAATVEQVRPLLPGAASCAVLVTSRDSLAGLVAVDGAHRVDLDLLPQADALALLRRLIGPRVDSEPRAAEQLADLCARLPLALRIAAELAVSRPAGSLATLVAELGDRPRRLDLLAAGEDPHAAVRTVFSWSMQHLPAPAREAFALLGLHPGPDFDAYAAAALTGSQHEPARRALDRLTRAHLVHPTGAGRYGMHDLLRAYAAHLATVEVSEQDQHAAVERLLTYYLSTASAAMDRLYPAEADRRPHVQTAVTPAPVLTDADAARGWLYAELPCLVAASRFGATSGWYQHAIELSGVLFTFLESGSPAEALAVHEHAHQAALRIADHSGQANALRFLGVTHSHLGAFPLATRQLQQARDLCQQVGDRAGEAVALYELGKLAWRLGHYRDAADRLQQALKLFRQVGDQTREASALTNLGGVEKHLGRYRSAIAHLEQGLALQRGIGNALGQAHALANLGGLEERLGRYETAANHLQQALTLIRALGHRQAEATILETLGIVYVRLDQPATASAHLERALTLFRDVGDRAGETWTLNGLGEVAHARSRYADATALYTQALDIASEIGVHEPRAYAHTRLGHLHRDLGDSTRARTHYEQALTLYAGLDLPEADDLRTHLAGLTDRAIPSS